MSPATLLNQEWSVGALLTILREPDQIDKSTLEITPADDETYTNMQELADELPDHSPRYILLSYPLTLVCRARWGYSAQKLTAR